MNLMIVLGIESTAHTFGIGIVRGKRILSNVKDTFYPKKGSGMIPLEVAEHHSEVAGDILAKSLRRPI
jgi:N6-L-threonylcarbamoyladenine synthase